MSKTAQKRSLETRFMEFEVVCRRCQSKWQPAIARFVNVGTDPDARLGILINTMHHSFCPQCRLKQYIDTTFEYYDPEENIVIQVRPEWEFKAGGGEDYYLKRLEDLVYKYSKNDVRVDVVFGLRELIDKYLGGEDAVEAAKAEWYRRKEVAKKKHEERTLAKTAFEPDSPDDAEDEDSTTTA